jgi:hypothetical protein
MIFLVASESRGSDEVGILVGLSIHPDAITAYIRIIDAHANAAITVIVDLLIITTPFGI